MVTLAVMIAQVYSRFPASSTGIEVAEPIRISAAPDAAELSTTAGTGPVRRTRSLVPAAPSSPPTPPAVTTSPTCDSRQVDGAASQEDDQLVSAQAEIQDEREAAAG